MRRLLALLGIVGVLALVLWLATVYDLGGGGEASPAAPSAPSASPAPSAETPDPSATTGGVGGSAHPAIPSNARETRVSYVHDGDTLYLQPDPFGNETEVKVRLLGIDTPELRLTAECGAVIARDALRALVPEGTRVFADRDVELYDPYDRELLYLWLADGTFVNLAMIEDGHAEAVRIRPNEAYWPLLRDAEAAAAGDGVGMWGSC